MDYSHHPRRSSWGRIRHGYGILPAPAGPPLRRLRNDGGTGVFLNMQRFTVFGHPIAHSLSPRLHALFAAQCGIELEYTATDAPPERFARIARDFFASGGRGANVTLPEKRLAFELANTHTQAARRVGVANVLTR